VASWLKEECLQLELERMKVAEEEQKKQEAAAAAEEAEKKRKELEEFKRREDEANEVHRARKAEAAKKTELVDKGEKQGREESVEVMVGSMLSEKGVFWRLKEGLVCEGCVKSEENCYWKDSLRATACWHCHLNKKTCVVRAGKDGPEAGSSKKRKVVMKGKRKEKLELELGLGVDPGAVLLVEMQGLREEVGGVREEIG